MKIIKIEYLIKKGLFSHSALYSNILDEITTSIHLVRWPKGAAQFSIYPEKDGNGVVPIKASCMESLISYGWKTEQSLSLASRIKPGPVDAIKEVPPEKYFAVEWETGNISSSHRALNKMAVGLIDGTSLLSG